MRLTNYFIKKKVQSLASGAAGRKHEFCALEDAGHILVLYQANDRELVEPCLDVLHKKNKKVPGLCLCNRRSGGRCLVHPGPCQEGCERLAGSFRCHPGTVQDGQGGYSDRSYAPRLLPDAISYATASLQIQGGSEACRYRFV